MAPLLLRAEANHFIPSSLWAKPSFPSDRGKPFFKRALFIWQYLLYRGLFIFNWCVSGSCRPTSPTWKVWAALEFDLDITVLETIEDRMDSRCLWGAGAGPGNKHTCRKEACEPLLTVCLPRGGWGWEDASLEASENSGALPTAVTMVVIARGRLLHSFQSSIQGVCQFLARVSTASALEHLGNAGRR